MFNSGPTKNELHLTVRINSIKPGWDSHRSNTTSTNTTTKWDHSRMSHKSTTSISSLTCYAHPTTTKLSCHFVHMNGGTVNHLTYVDSHEQCKIVSVGQTETALKDITVDTTLVKEWGAPSAVIPTIQGTAFRNLITNPTKNDIFNSVQTKQFFFLNWGHRTDTAFTMQHFVGITVCSIQHHHHPVRTLQL